MDTQSTPELLPNLWAAFWANVAKAGPDDCWLWTGRRNRGGYGILSDRVSDRPATHVALEIDGRPRPQRHSALHSCDNPPCCNPGHLRWGTPADNAADMMERRHHQSFRKTECPHGHPLAGDNLIIRQNGRRGCRICQRAHGAKYRARRRAGVHSPNPAAINARKTHCPRDHEYTPENTWVRNGQRYCRACQKIHKLAAYRRNRAAAQPQQGDAS